MSRRAVAASTRPNCGRAWQACCPATCFRPAGYAAIRCRETPMARWTVRSCAGDSCRPRPRPARERRLAPQRRCGADRERGMCERNAALERLRTLFLRHLHLEVPSADTDLLETGLLDSLQLVDLLVLIEQEFGRRIALEAIELDDLRSLSRLAQLVSTPAEPAQAAQAVPICDQAQSAQPEPMREGARAAPRALRSEEHTSELQSLAYL